MPGHRTAETGDPLPRWADRYADLGVAGVAVGTVLGLLAFVTNPVPDPSFPWATLPASLRVLPAQPRIEHWPVSYTLAIWLWVFGLPGVVLAGYRRYGGTDRWLVALPPTAMLALTTYCRFFWPKLDPATWNAPSYTFVCWGYCSSYVPAWSNLAYAVALVGVVAAVLARRDSRWAPHTLGAFGVLALPLGAPALVAAIHRHSAGASTEAEQSRS